MKTHRYWYRITLHEPLVLSSKNITTSGQESLDFLPGRILLGVAASRTYSKIGDQAWTAFHSGKVRFLDALPEAPSGRLAIPTPLSFQLPKRSRDTLVLNQALAENPGRDASTQYTGFGAPYLDIDPERGLTKVRIEKSSSVKTAIDASKRGASRDGYLFQYEAIERGQSFLAALDFDSDVDIALIDTIEAAILGHQRIGRSRTAEFGAISIEKLSENEPDGHRLTALEAGATSATIILLSDLALLDARSGSPRLEPFSSDFGLPENWHLNLKVSTIRRRSFDRFNGHRKSFDLKREVLSRGSVLVFDAPAGAALSEQELQKALVTCKTGTGLDRQEGLGQYLLQPKWAATPTFVLNTGPKAFTESPLLTPPDPALAAFLASRSQQLTAEESEILYGKARKIAEFCNKEGKKAPGRSQWSRVRRWARVAPLSMESFIELTGGTKGVLTKGWELHPTTDQTLADIVVEYGASQDSLAKGRHLVSELAHLVRARLRTSALEDSPSKEEAH